MKVFDSIDSFNELSDGIVICIGKADALHLGHIALINETIRLAAKLDTQSGILSLLPDENNPIFNADSFRMVLTKDERRMSLSNWPIDNLIYQKMTMEFTNIGPNEFVKDILIQKIGVQGVVVGFDYRFGKNRAGDTELLKRLSIELGFQLEVVEAVVINGKLAKTTLIREIIESGDLREAQKYLGYPFFATGKVISGRGIGRKIGFPTVNLEIPSEKILPKRGVYIVRGFFADQCRWGLANVGVNPTVDSSDNVHIEVWLKDFDGDLTGENVKVEFFKFVRDEVKFDSLELLAEQIKKDIQVLNEFIA